LIITNRILLTKVSCFNLTDAAILILNLLIPELIFILQNFQFSIFFAAINFRDIKTIINKLLTIFLKTKFMAI